MMGLPLFCENRRNEPQVLSLLVLLERQLPGLKLMGYVHKVIVELEVL